MLVQGSVLVPCVKPDLNKANPRLGVGLLAFSSDSKYFYTRNGQYSLTMPPLQPTYSPFIQPGAKPSNKY